MSYKEVVNGWIPPQLRALLGSTLEDVDHGSIDRLKGVSEGDQIEFKEQMYSGREGDKKELCLDVAQFANSAGGLLIIGIEEDDEGTATAIRPIEPDPKRADLIEWFDQTTTSRVAPFLTAGRRTIPYGNDGGIILLIAVPPSLGQPHAVSSGAGLVYPVRTGRVRNNLSEFQVADRYRRRFEAVATGAERARTLHELGTAAIPSHREASIDRATVWMVVSLSPDVTGEVSMSRSIAARSLDWFRARHAEAPHTAMRVPRIGTEATFVPRYRALILRSGWRDEYFPNIRCQLNLDGSAFIAFSQWGNEKMTRFETWSDVPEDSQGFGVRTIDVTIDLINAVWILAGHAARCGAIGAATVQAQLVAENPDLLVPATLADEGRVIAQVADTAPAPSPSPVVSRTVPIDWIVASSEETESVVRGLSQDLLSHFGLPEAPEFNDDGQLDLQQLPADLSSQVTSWREESAGPGHEDLNPS